MAEEAKQEPERPKKRKTMLSLPIMIIIGVVVLAVLIGGTLFAVNMMVSSQVETLMANVDSTGGKGGHQKVEKKAHSEEDAAMAELEEQDYLDEVPTTYFETGRIITNPRSSSSYVVLNLGLEFREKPKEGEKAAEVKQGAEMTPEMKRLMAKIKDVINTRIASMSESDIEAKRDSLKLFFKNDLIPIFKKDKKFLKDIILVEYIKQ